MAKKAEKYGAFNTNDFVYTYEEKASAIKKVEYAKEYFKTIPNGKKEVLDEVIYQIRVCEDLCLNVTESTIESWCHCTSVISVQNKARTLKLTA